MNDDFGKKLIAMLPRLRRFALSLCRSPALADDLVQTACEKAIAGRDGWRTDSNFDAWMYRILRNAWIDALRKRRTEGIQEDIDGRTDLASGDESRNMESRLTLKHVAAAIGDLPDDLRDVVLLVCVEDLAYRDAADVLGVPIGTVMSRLARARVRLARATGYEMKQT